MKTKERRTADRGEKKDEKKESTERMSVVCQVTQSHSEQRAWTEFNVGPWLLISSPLPTRQPLTPMKSGFSIPNDHMAEGDRGREEVGGGRGSGEAKEEGSVQKR